MPPSILSGVTVTPSRIARQAASLVEVNCMLELQGIRRPQYHAVKRTACLPPHRVRWNRVRITARFWLWPVWAVTGFSNSHSQAIELRS